MTETVFLKIIAREIPAEIVYEDEHTLAFLDIAPNTPGHTLVIPKKYAKNIFDVDEETLAQVMRTVRKLAPIVRDAVGAKGVHINSNHEHEGGQEVFHLHFHIIPRMSREEFDFCWPKHTLEETGGAEVAKRIRASLA
jgi:histidine triad (HIT) family protein